MSLQLKQLVLRAALVVCVWAGFIQGHDGMRNIATFIVWALLVGILLLGEKIKEPRPKGLPFWITGTTDAFMVGSMVWSGAWWTALAYTFVSLVGHGTRLPKESTP